ncbi:MAG: redoxin domain-containing protein [Candidatus Hydrogenedentes bacterium]|jgi:thiol-disulfide isomerase/thioredoxin|nr:redoxin domain-containing protein [Candidatus Hydrogenedentota bacterium]
MNKRFFDLRTRVSGVMFTGAAAMCVLAAAATSGWASETKDKAVSIGDTMPDFKLKDLDGKAHSLSAHKDKVVVVAFVSHECPWSRGADPLLSGIAKEFTAKGVVFIGIDSGNNTDAEQIKAYSAKKNLSYPRVKDPENVYADRVQAKKTPEVYVVDGLGKVAYHGAVDNRKQPEVDGDTNHLADALDSVLAGEKVSVPNVMAWGCTIKRIPKKSS